jgi:RNA polymerase sigma factor (sigma-70 family)
MPTSRMNEVIHHLRNAARRAEGADLTDGQLLESFVRRQGSAALEALVRRHAAMVWGVCRRILQHHHDAEDAFQATFLVLIRKAASITPKETVGNWLYGVAHQTALKARATRAKRRRREAQQTTIPEPAVVDQDLWSDLQPWLDKELSLLPDKYRVVIVLCDLEGKTRQEAARHLGCPEGTVGSRLARARTMLAKRLARHGLAVSGGVLAAALTQAAISASVPASLMSFTIKAVTLVAAGKAASSLISAPVATLSEGVMKAMLLNKIMKVTATLAVVATALIGAGLLSYGTAEEQRTDPKDGQRQEVLVRRPKQSEAAPMQQFTGRLGKPQGDSIAVAFAVDERSYLQYQRLLQKHQVKGPGSPVSIALADEDGFPHQGTLKDFEGRIDAETGAVQAHAALPNPDRLLLEGMFVRVRIPFGPTQKVLQVSDEAVLCDQGKHFLLVVTGEDIVERRAVSLGAADGNMRIITKGVNSDDWIVVGLVGGINNLMPGTPVKRRIVGDSPKEPKGADKDKPQQDEQGKSGPKEDRKGKADPAEGSGDPVAKQLWAGMSINQPLFRVGKDTNLLQFNFALVNESDKVIDPRIPGYPRLVVNGKELDVSSIPGAGLRDERFQALPPGDNLQFGMAAGRFFEKPGVYRVYWQGEGFRSNEVDFRVVK